MTGGYDGLIVVWNTDSGAVAAHLAPPGLSHASLQERSIEQVPLPCFLPWVCLNGGKTLHCIHVLPDWRMTLPYVCSHGATQTLHCIHMLQATRVKDGTGIAAGML